MDKITWDDTYVIAKILKSTYPNRTLETVTLNEIYSWVVQLPEFEDDPNIINDTILVSIYTEWFEEVNPV